MSIKQVKQKFVTVSSAFAVNSAFLEPVKESSYTCCRAKRVCKKSPEVKQSYE